MNSADIVKRFKESDCIYGRMYGNEYRTIYDHGKVRREKELVLKLDIKTDGIELHEEKEMLLFTWGWPGPDYNIYRFADYGKTWSFDEGELEEYDRTTTDRQASSD